MPNPRTATSCIRTAIRRVFNTPSKDTPMTEPPDYPTMARDYLDELYNQITEQARQNLRDRPPGAKVEVTPVMVLPDGGRLEFGPFYFERTRGDEPEPVEDLPCGGTIRTPGPLVDAGEETTCYSRPATGRRLAEDLGPACDLDRGENPFGWTSPDPDPDPADTDPDHNPDRIQTLDGTPFGPPDTTVTSADSGPDNPDPSPDAQRLALVRQALLDDGYFTPDEVGPDLAPRVSEALRHYRDRAEHAEADLKNWARNSTDLRRRISALTEERDQLRKVLATQEAETMHQLDRAEQAEAGLKTTVSALNALARHQITAAPTDPEAERAATARAHQLAGRYATSTRRFARLHQAAEQNVTRVTALYENWVKAGPPPRLGTGFECWWSNRLAELKTALTGPDEAEQKH